MHEHPCIPRRLKLRRLAIEPRYVQQKWRHHDHRDAIQSQARGIEHLKFVICSHFFLVCFIIFHFIYVDLRLFIIILVVMMVEGDTNLVFIVII